MNKGERAELQTVLSLINMRDSGFDLPRVGTVRTIRFVGSDNDVPDDVLPVGFALDSIASDSCLTSLCNDVGLKKAGAFDKADVYVNGLGISIKCIDCAAPAIINHTVRPGWERVCSNLNGSDISILDSIIDSYWMLRRSGKIGEDVSNSDSNSPFAGCRDYLSPIIGYFLSSGTGAKDSEHPAAWVLEVGDPLDSTTWKIFSPSDYISCHWDSLVFSVRSKKGMPTNYPEMKDLGKKASVERWTQYYQGAYRGALHVRAKKIR